MTNSKLFRTTFITSQNTKDKNIRKDISYHADFMKVNFFEKKKELSRQDYLSFLYNGICKEWITKTIKVLKDGTKKEVYSVNRKFRNEISSSEWIGENSVSVIASVPKIETQVYCLQNIVKETKQILNPRTSTKSETSETSETSENSESSKRTKSEVLKNFSDIWLKEFDEDLLAMLEFASSAEGAKISDYSVEQKAKKVS